MQIKQCKNLIGLSELIGERKYMLKYRNMGELEPGVKGLPRIQLSPLETDAKVPFLMEKGQKNILNVQDRSTGNQFENA